MNGCLGSPGRDYGTFWGMQGRRLLEASVGGSCESTRGA